MRKCHWPEIKGINFGMVLSHIAANCIVDASTLNEIVTHRNLEFLTIEHFEDKVMFRDLKWIVKLQAQHLDLLSKSNSNCRHQRN